MGDALALEHQRAQRQCARWRRRAEARFDRRFRGALEIEVDRRGNAQAAVLFVLAAGLRGYDLADPPFMALEEAGHVPSAGHYWRDGQFQPDTWEHPPLRHLTLCAFTAVLGDGPLGWRLRNVLFGALAAQVKLYAGGVGRNSRG